LPPCLLARRKVHLGEGHLLRKKKLEKRGGSRGLIGEGERRRVEG
jgi:hypothetical protein